MKAMNMSSGSFGVLLGIVVLTSAVGGFVTAMVKQSSQTNAQVNHYKAQAEKAIAYRDREVAEYKRKYGQKLQEVEEAQFAKENARKAQEIALEIQEVNSRIEKSRDRRMEANRVAQQAIDAANKATAKGLLAASGQLLAKTQKEILPIIAAYEKELGELSLTNYTLWLRFKSAFNMAGTAYHDALPSAYNCDATTDYELRKY